MKNFFKILFALVLAAGVITGVYYHINGNTLPQKAEPISLTTVTKPPATEKYSNKRLLASLKDEGYYLYSTDDKLLLTHGKKEFEFNKWTSYMDTEKPTLYYLDLNGDKVKELVVRCVSGEDLTTGNYIYDLYILKLKDGGKEAYNVISASQTTWHNILDSGITEELSQLKNCKKYVQFAMTVKGKSIAYDKKTGIAGDGAGFVGYVRALQNDKGEYMTVNNWSKGKGGFYIENGKLCCEVEVNINYKNSNAYQQAGKIYFEMYIGDSDKLYVTKKSLVFKTDSAYIVSDPTDTAQEPWSVTIKNSSSQPGGEEINWIKYSTHIDADTLMSTVDLGSEATDIRFVDSIVISEANVVMTAKNGYTFDKDAGSKGEFSLTINKGGSSEYEISYTAAVSEDGKTLTLNYDKTYKQSSIKTIDFSYGSK